MNSWCAYSAIHITEPMLSKFKKNSYVETQLTRECQKRCIRRVMQLSLEQNACLVNQFCGTGKTRIIIASICHIEKQLSVIVVPSLALVQQMYDDYLSDSKIPRELSKHIILNVSSKTQAELIGTSGSITTMTLDDIHIDCTTDPSTIQRFLNRKDRKQLICVTYQSLPVLIENLNGHRIGVACFDEAHNSVGDVAQQSIYSKTVLPYYEFRIFFTATPTNKNGIVMYDHEDNSFGKYGHCGPLHPDCHYTYLQGLRDGILSLFNICVDMFTGTVEMQISNILECIARAILTYGNTRVLTFHGDVSADSKSETSVLRFVATCRSEFQEIFRRVCATEFPELVSKFANANISIYELTAETKDKKAILKALKDCSDTDICIVSSCKTIREGVDTHTANMVVFVDPKTSVNEIIQNIGRIVRKLLGARDEPVTVLLPVRVDTTKYLECKGDIVKRDQVFREQLNNGVKGDFNAILNVCAALNQSDPELYKQILQYPSVFTKEERRHALNQQGLTINEDVTHWQSEVDVMIEDGMRVEIHTSDTENPVTIYNADGKKKVCLYQCDSYEDSNEDCDSYDEDCDSFDEDLNADCDSFDDEPTVKKDSEYQLISRSWETQNSSTTHSQLTKDPSKWFAYHNARDHSFQGYDQAQIPRNRIIQYLEQKKHHKIRILDMGCGRNYISKHFASCPKITIIGYDHVAEPGTNARVGNIRDLSGLEEEESADFCVYSQSLMGHDHHEYLKEGVRLLRFNGEIIISCSNKHHDMVIQQLHEYSLEIVKDEYQEDHRWFLTIARKV